MFCPKCGTLGYIDQTNNLNCSNYKCGYLGNAQNVISTAQGQLDLSQVVTVTPSGVEEKARGSREYRNSMSPMWDEPTVRIQSTNNRKCTECNSSNLRIRCSEEECLDCGSHVS
jgi:hypothetical protein